MKRASANYSIAMDKQFRDRTYAVVSLGLVNLEAQKSARVTSDLLYVSRNTNIFSGVLGNPPQYATMEENVFKADGSQFFAPHEDMADSSRFDVSAVTSDVKGTLTVEFDVPQDIVGLSLSFTEFYPTEFKIVTDTGVERTYENEERDWFCTDNFDGISSFSIVPISFENGSNKRLRVISISMGVGVVFSNDDISELTIDDNTSFTSEELPNINGKVTCIDLENMFNVDNPNSYLPFLQYGQRILTYVGQTLENGEVEYIKQPVMYLTSWSANSQKVSLVMGDRLSTLTNKYTLGNSIHSRSLYAEAESVFTDAGLEPDEYEIDDSLQDIIITNPMPELTHAECLQLIANAGRCILRQADNGAIKLVANFENIIDPLQLTVQSDSHAGWSKPANVRTGRTCVYADMTQHFFSADGSMTFMSNTGQYLETGYVSLQVADSNGNFYNNLLSDGRHINESQHGVTFTSNQDGSITANGTVDSTGYANYWLYQLVTPLTLEPGEYMLSGCPSGGGNTTYRLAIRTTGTSYTSPGWDIGEGDTFTITESTDVGVYIQISTTGNTVENLTFRPMLVKLDDYITEPAGYVQGKVPSLSMELPATFTYFGVNIKFDGNMPEKMKIEVYNGSTKKDEVSVTPTSNDMYLPYDFINFDKLIFTFPKGAPNSRVLINKISFGKISDYTLKHDDMLEKPLSTMEEIVKAVEVRICSFENSTVEGEAPRQIDDNVYYSYPMNYRGHIVQFSNPLIGNEELAQSVAEWLGNYYNNNVTYQVNYRGDPRIDSADIIFMQNEFLNNLQVNVERHSLKFNGALSGKLDLRRADRLI